MSQMVKPAINEVADGEERLSEVEKAYRDAMSSTGTTMQQNAIYMESLEAKTTALKAEFEKFVLGNGGLQDFAKKSVDVAKSILELTNKIGGLSTVLKLLLALTIISKINSIKTAITTLGVTLGNLSTSFGALSTTLQYASSHGVKFSSAMKQIGTSAEIAQVGVAALTTIISLAIVAWGAYQAKIAETKAQLEESRQAYESYRDTVSTTLSKIENEYTSKTELLKINKQLNDSYDDEQEKLKGVNDLRKENIGLLYEENQAKAREYIAEHSETGDAAIKYLESETNELKKRVHTLREELASGENEYSTQKIFGDMIDELETLSKMKPEDAINAITSALTALDAEKERNGGLTHDQILREEELRKQLVKIKQPTEDARKEADGLTNARNTLKQSEEEWLNTVRQEQGQLGDIDTAMEYTAEQLDALKEQYNITDEAIKKLIDDQTNEIATESQAVNYLIENAEAAKEAKDSYEELSKATSQLESEISALATALTEQENNGSIALKTQLELIDAGYAAALAYDEETGACKLDAEAVQTLVEAKIRERIASLENARASLVEKLQAEGQAALTTAGCFLQLAKAKNIANEASLTERKTGTTSGNAVDATDPRKSYNATVEKTIKEGAVEANAEVQKLDAQIDALESSLKQIQNVGVKAFGTIGKSSAKAGSGAKKAAKSTKDATKSTEDATKKAEEAKKKAIEETTQAIQKQINALDEEIAQIDKQTEAIQKQISALEKTKSEYERVFSFITKKIEDRIKEIEAEKDAAVQASEAIVKAKEEEKDTILAGIEAEISALEEAKEAREKYWDEEIDALKNKNKEYKESLELQEKLDALEKAKNTKVKVYKKGQGFVYDVDQTEVQKAQKELDEYLKERDYEDELEKLENLKNAEIENYNTRINELNKFKDKTQKTYEEEIKNLEANTKALEQQYDEQIAIYQGYKTEFENMLNAYQNSQDELLASQLTGINFENDNWMTRIGNLQSFVDNYTAGIREIERLNEEEAKLNAEKARLAEEREELQRRLNEAKNGESSDSSSSNSTNYDSNGDIDLASPNRSSSSSGGGIDLASNSKPSYYSPPYSTPVQNWTDKGGSGATGDTSGNQGYTRDALDAQRRKLDAAKQGIKNINTALEAARKRAGYASGIGYVQDDQIAVVGENPHQEIVLGSKVNNGQLMSLGKGSGVVNAKGTNTLADILNQFGKFGASKFGQGNGVLNNNTNNESLVINGVTIQGANISDPQSFVNGLLSLKAEALQRAYKAH